MEAEVAKQTNIKKVSIIILAVVAVIYLGASLYFTKHFYFNCIINGVDVSGDTVEETEDKMTKELEAYTLTLKGREDKNEELLGKNVGLKYISTGEIQQAKDKQNPFSWPISIFKKEEYEISSSVEYDEKMLNDELAKMVFYKDENVVEPKDSYIEYKDGTYNIIDEIYGNKVNRETLTEKVKKSVVDGETLIDLDKDGYYYNPKYTSKSSEVVDAAANLNKYVSAKVNYNFGGNTESVNGDMIHQWIGVDNEFQVSIDESKVSNYISSLAGKYNTRGRTRSFKTSSGNIINISGGDYGWVLDSNAETSGLIEAIKNGQEINKEPSYSQKGRVYGANDIGDTYVEIDMTKQHMWFYKNGSLITEGDVVTGDMQHNWGTPGGIYRLKYKEKNATLVGQDYVSPVSFWMPFNGGIGIHDATWRDVFGKEEYKTNGSHGCINSPYAVANAIFDNIEAGTPIVCFY